MKPSKFCAASLLCSSRPILHNRCSMIPRNFSCTIILQMAEHAVTAPAAFRCTCAHQRKGSRLISTKPGTDPSAVYIHALAVVAAKTRPFHHSLQHCSHQLVCHTPHHTLHQLEAIATVPFFWLNVVAHGESLEL
jgi:hypothetical protein